TTWENLVEKFIQKFYQLSDDHEEMETDEDGDPDDIAEIFKIEDNLFDFETPLCKAFNEFNYLLKIDTDLFTFDIQEIKTYEEYELNNNMTGELEEPWSDNGILMGSYDTLTDRKLKEEALTHKARITNDYDVFVKLEECLWKVNAHEKSLFTRWENHDQGPFPNTKTKKDYDPYLDINRIFGGDYGLNNVGNIQENWKEYHNSSICKIRRFEMMKYSFDADDEYVAIKERKHSRTDIDAYQAY
ncbi:hypothetical protein Tco_1199000, partial [Tanacetum coccineum]